MNRANDILEELKSMGSNLGDLPRAMPYHLPVGYFENLSASMREVIHEISSPEAVPVWGKAMPHSVPQGYFESFADNVLSDLYSKALPGLTMESPYQVPAGYFEALPGQMLATAKASDPVKKTAKIIPLTSTYSVRPIRWAAAAILMLFIGFGGFFYLQPSSSDTDMILASVPKTEIKDYLQGALRIDVDRVVDNDINNLQVNNQEIVEYLDENGWDMVD